METFHLDISNDHLQTELAGQCALNVVIGTDGFSYLVTDPEQTVLTFKSWHFAHPGQGFQNADADIRKIFGLETHLSLPFGQVRCALYNANATLVPRRLFNAGELPAYFQLLLPAADYVYGYDELPEFDCYLAFATEPDIQRLCRLYFPKAPVQHLAAAVIRGFQRQRANQEHEVCVNIRNQSAQVLVFDRNNLVFYNSFHCSRASDLLYFTLLAYDQCRISPRDTPLLLAGDVLADSEIYRLLYRYIRNIRFVARPEAYQFRQHLNDVPDHLGFDLMSLKYL